MGTGRRSPKLIPEDNLKDMDPEQIAMANEESRKLARRGVKDVDAIDKALLRAKRRKERDKVAHGIDLNRP